MQKLSSTYWEIVDGKVPKLFMKRTLSFYCFSYIEPDNEAFAFCFFAVLYIFFFFEWGQGWFLLTFYIYFLFLTCLCVNPKHGFMLNHLQTISRGRLCCCINWIILLTLSVYILFYFIFLRFGHDTKMVLFFSFPFLYCCW